MVQASLILIKGGPTRENLSRIGRRPLRRFPSHPWIPAFAGMTRGLRLLIWDSIRLAWFRLLQWLGNCRPSMCGAFMSSKQTDQSAFLP